MKILGILNLTPDSFSDGGSYSDSQEGILIEQAVARAWAMLDEGAAAIDVGGESTRPGSEAVSVEEEIARVQPVLAELHKQEFPAPISLDTRRAQVLEACLPHGVKILNDTAALSDDAALGPLAASAGVEVVLMHRQGQPKTMQVQPSYSDLCGEVAAYLLAQVDYAIECGISQERILLDPGLGFGKSEEDNYALMRALPEMDVRGLPWLIGASRKSFLGRYDDSAPRQRVYSSLAFAMAAEQMCAKWVRVHDVRATRILIDTYRDTQALGLDSSNPNPSKI